MVHQDKAALSVSLTNPDLLLGNSEKLLRDTVFMARTKFLWNAVCYERVNIENFGRIHLRLRVELRFDADFHDLFEVRGTQRQLRGEVTPRVLAPDRVEFRYAGLDQIERRTSILVAPTPRVIETNRAVVEVDLAPEQHISLFLTVSCEEAGKSTQSDFLHAYRAIRRARRASTADIATVGSSNELFDEVICRATSDIYTLITHTKNGPYPYAGIPWFSTIFGRDGIITAMLMLWLDPTIARGVLCTLADSQAHAVDAKSDAEPGKILHEMRHGEMANRGEVPFRRYYGSVDATPLFIMLAGMYFERTGDHATITAIWPNLLAALRWIDQYGDRDGDGFVEYQREWESGLVNQGWKNFHDAIFHADGTDAKGPIALCEMQGYVFAAKQYAARMAKRQGSMALFAALSQQAEQLRTRFEAAFWAEDLGTYALALDGEKRACRVRASNAGHLLFTGITAPDRARRVAATLMNSDGFSGWGIRTLARDEPRYNPMSYHNGSVWPHDNALIALGFVRYGLKAEAVRVFQGISDAARHQELGRLPELFCGFVRRPHRGPVPYPVACSPQAWASAAVFGLLAACLGLEIAHEEDEIRFRDPAMPAFLDEVVIRNMRLGATRADIRLHRYGDDVTPMSWPAREQRRF